MELTAMDNLEQVEKNLENVDPGVIQTFLKDLVPEVLAFGLQIIIAVVIYIIGHKLIKSVIKGAERALARGNAEEGVITFASSFLKITLHIILILLIGSNFGITTASVIAVVGSAGLTAGLALQGSLSNFAGGVLILLLKPFRVGDYIIEDTNKNEGKVQEITIFYTKLTTLDNKVVVIPNGVLANSSMTNVTHQDERLIDIKVGISYEASIKQAKAVIENVLMSEQCRCEDEEIKVFVHELGDSAVIIGCRLWVAAEQYWEVRWRLNEEIKEALDRNGIEIPYPQVAVTMKK